MTKFNVVVNPFSQRVLISARINKISCEVVVEYSNWIVGDMNKYFNMNGTDFLLSMSYEDELFIGIYDDNDYAIQSPYPTTFKLTHKDEF